jgi:hypothetical protein
MGPFAGPGEYGLATEPQRHREKALDKKARIADGRAGEQPFDCASVAGFESSVSALRA